jgi:DNA modification methylase
MDYNSFIQAKTKIDYDNGFEIEESIIHKSLFDWQKAVVKWAVKKGQAALYEDCGLGKTRQQLEWLRIMMSMVEGNGIGLVVCPLSVAEQTTQEAEKIDVKIEYVTDESMCKDGLLYITNYERLEHFENVKVKAVVLDESSILKAVGGKTKNRVIAMFKDVNYKLSCTATPSPNDISELGNQVDFLGLMSRAEMLSKWFVNDPKFNGYRLKGHAKKEFYKWMASWAVFIRKPSDIGFSDNGYTLPDLKITAEYVDVDFIPEGELVPVTEVKGLAGRLDVRQKTFIDKVSAMQKDIEKTEGQWLIFCGLNPEADAVEKNIPDCVQVAGLHSPEYKNETFWKFKKGEVKHLVTKGKIGGFGMNFQNSHNMGFIGLGDSFELYYQCIRRQYRFGQKQDVNVRIYLTNAEQAIYQNVLRKEEETNRLFDEVVKEMQDFTKEEIGKGHAIVHDIHEVKTVKGEGWTAHRGDVIETIHLVDDESVDMQIFSPPFFSLFTYSPSPRDMGNNTSDAEFWSHFDFLIPELYKKLKPGRVCAVHCMDVPATLVKDGYIGLKDLRGDIIKHFQQHGYIYDGCAFIPKNPQAQSIRTHAKGLTFTQFEKDSSWSRPSLPDYLIKFRKPGENKAPVANGENGEISRDEWIEIASGIWSSTVRETYTLNTIKYPGDEAHLCPLQLDTIHNAIRLWSNKGDVVQSPFGGIGSEGYQAILDGRRAVLHELKPEYFDQLCKNLTNAVKKTHEGMLDF